MVENELQQMMQCVQASQRRAEHAASEETTLEFVETVHSSETPTTSKSAIASSNRSNTSAEFLNLTTVRGIPSYYKDNVKIDRPNDSH